jgi:signal transduction histidine kinase
MKALTASSSALCSCDEDSVSRFRPAHLTFTIVPLVLTLGVACALAWQAHQAARSHREAAERVLQDYVGFAGWEFARAARRELDSVFDRWLQVINCAASGPLPEPSQLATRDGCRCDDLTARGLFRLDLKTGVLETTGEALDEGSRRAVATAARPAGPPRAIHSVRTVRFASVGGRTAIVAARGQHDRADRPTVIGFFAEPSALREPIERVVQRTPLLPPTLAGSRTDLVSVGVRTAGGLPVVTPRSIDGAASTGGVLDESVGGLQYDVWLHSDAAEHLVIGGLPHSRLPLLLGLLALTGGLVVAAAFQLRREHELTRLRSDFVSSVSHELRTPLAQIRLFSETLLLGRVRSEAEGRRSLEIIQQESRRLTHLVDNVLYFSRGERGVARLSLAPARVADLASQAIEAFAPLAQSAGSELRLDVLDDVVAPVDGGAVRQILLNLIDNAVKYGRAGQTVRVTVSASDGIAVLAVEDGGPGVPEDARASIFQPYCRLASTSVSAVAGTGIGLAVVRDLALLQGGSCRVEGGAAGGARFIVELPDAVSATAPAVVRHGVRAPA